jgi:CubicO group peptidase (beta-lactamase class C family)
MSLNRAFLVIFLAAIVAWAGVVAYRLLGADGADYTTDTPANFAEIDRFVADQASASRIPGLAYAVVRRGEVMHAQGFGGDGRGNDITPDTPFWIGSNTKSFTALATTQLIEAGQIGLDTPVREYVPELRLADEQASSQITIRHLLNQTSGFSRETGVEPVLHEKQQTLEEAVADLAGVELNRPVGESFEYSNVNFVLLGLVIQRVSGQTWQAYIDEHIFGPLGMTRSYTSHEAAKANGLTSTYRYAFGLRLETEGKYLPGVAPTGYLYSTAVDMSRYLSAYLNGGELEGARVVSPEGAGAMLALATNSIERTLQGHEFTYGYGRGWFVGPFGVAEDARWHLGNLPNFTAWMVLLPETGEGVVVLINAGSQFEFGGANGVMSRIPRGIVNMLRAEAPPTGHSMTDFYVVFNGLVVIVVAIQLWSLVRVAVRATGVRDAGGLHAGRARFALPLAWEIPAGLYLALLYPATLGGWPSALRSLPDLSLVAAIVAAFWLLTAVIRLAKLVIGR